MLEFNTSMTKSESFTPHPSFALLQLTPWPCTRPVSPDFTPRWSSEERHPVFASSLRKRAPSATAAVDVRGTQQSTWSIRIDGRKAKSASFECRKFRLGSISDLFMCSCVCLLFLIFVRILHPLEINIPLKQSHGRASNV